ncbi:MAG: TRAP transporter small permease subunit [Gammaproteobacteria bacterium]|nr:TRAP transporter small permease subunit [Gammaproteobacteria bacterium]
MKFLTLAAKTSSSIIDRTNQAVGKTISWLVVLMVLITFSIVVMRYLFNSGSIQAQESVIYMHAVVFMLAAASTLKQDGHVRVDIFYGKMSLRNKAIVNFLGNLFLVIPVCTFILWSSWEYVFDAWEIKETSREAGGLPGVYLLKSVIIIFTGMLILQGIAEALKSLLIIFSKPENATFSESKTNITD